MNLSKSRYCKGIRCPKILWLDEHKSEVRDESVLNRKILDIGNKVGDLAMGYYGAYSEVPYNNDKSVMIAETKRLLNANTPIICEGSFSFNGNFCSVDILRVCGGEAEITEVKSSTDINPIYYDDIAFQYYVLSSCGLNVKKTFIMHINNEYERQGDINLTEFFTAQDCTEIVLSMQKDIDANIERFKKSAEEKNELDTEIGMYCFDPYECEYRTYCWKHIPKNSVFDISGHSLHRDKKFDLYKRGVISYKQLLESGEKLNDAALLQIETFVYKKPPVINKEAIRLFLDTLSYPLYFLDFETFKETIPPFDGLRPYMQVPFQYSLHIQETQGVVPEHREFLAKEGIDPREELAVRLFEDIPQNVCVLVYNMSFEKRCIKELSHWLEKQGKNEIAAHLMNIHDNIKDLMKPFQHRDYYSSELDGSYSIKKVLPALCPDDPELDYNKLDLVHNGIEAQTIYSELAEKNPEERERIRTALLAYCRLDTLAMVKILEKLINICL
ncbi:MAG: DUF2779 domain-containing protein [Brevinematales bacterium]|nr:DUF2779 domain-containing protein [Brevinematales bacterium]